MFPYRIVKWIIINTIHTHNTVRTYLKYRVSVLRGSLPKDVVHMIDSVIHVVFLSAAIIFFKLFLDDLCNFLWITYPDTLYGYISLDECGHPIVPKSEWPFYNTDCSFCEAEIVYRDRGCGHDFKLGIYGKDFMDCRGALRAVFKECSACSDVFVCRDCTVCSSCSAKLS